MKASISLFSQKGFAATPLQAIAKNSKTSHPLILRHFNSKEELLKEVQSYVSESNHHWVDSKISFDVSGRQALKIHCLENIKWAFENQDEAKIILLTYYYNSLTANKKQVNARQVGTQRILKYVKRVLGETNKEELELELESALFYSEVIQEFVVGQFVRLLTDTNMTAKRLPPSFNKKIQLFLDQILPS